MAESPTELRAEIDKLERKHAENPDGRYFVPLANDYRKLGDLDRAEGLLREGLRKHPDYLSAHIVLGRCLADRDKTTEAADEFTYVLSMDPQNLIALRSLGELALVEGRHDDAGRWYRELLAVDPMNDEARQALAQLEGPPAPAAPEGGAWWTSGDTAVDDEGDVAADGAGDDTAAAGARYGDAVESPFGGHRDEDVGDRPVGAFGEFIDLDEVPAEGDYAASAHSGADDVELDDGVESVEVVTETIAELYARQGLHDRAMDVYRELIRRRGGDAVLEQRLAELERSVAAAAEGSAPADSTPAAAPHWSADQDEEPSRETFTPEAPSGAPTDGVDALGDDPFADSFAHGFEERPAGTGSWTETSDGPDGGREAADTGADTGTADPHPVAEMGAEASPPASASSGGQSDGQPRDDRTIGAYLAGLARWAPGGAAAGAQASSTEPPASAEPHWEEPAAGVPTGEREFESDASAHQPDAWGGDGGWEAEAAGAVDDRPASPAPAADFASDPFPWELPADEPSSTSAGTDAAREPEAHADSSDADLGEVREVDGLMTTSQADADVEAEPSIGLDDYFPDDADAPAGSAAPTEPSTPPAAAEAGGDEEDDLESFQAWLRSLKR